jgi:hypothetical protein
VQIAHGTSFSLGAAHPHMHHRHILAYRSVSASRSRRVSGRVDAASMAFARSLYGECPSNGHLATSSCGVGGSTSAPRGASPGPQDGPPAAPGHRRDSGRRQPTIVHPPSGADARASRPGSADGARPNCRTLRRVSCLLHSRWPGSDREPRLRAIPIGAAAGVTDAYRHFPLTCHRAAAEQR